jgi:lipooligosaccharide transport system permease protein
MGGKGMGVLKMPRARLLEGLLTWPDLSWPLVYRVFYRNLLVFSRTWQANLMFNFVEPVIYLWALGFGLGVYVNRIQGLPYVSYTRMTVQKIFHSIVATPVSMDDVVLGEILYGAFKGVLYGLVFLVVVALFGLVKSFWALLAPVPIALMVTVFSVLSMIWTSIAPGFDSFGYFFTLLITPMFFFSGVFFPVDTLPAGIRLIAWFMPLYHAVEVVRPLILGTAGWAVAGHLAWLAIVVLLTLRIPLVMVKNRLIQ